MVMQMDEAPRSVQCAAWQADCHQRLMHCPKSVSSSQAVRPIPGARNSKPAACAAAGCHPEPAVDHQVPGCGWLLLFQAGSVVHSLLLCIMPLRSASPLCPYLETHGSALSTAVEELLACHAHNRPSSRPTPPCPTPRSNGFLLPYSAIPRGWKWLNRISPTTWCALLERDAL